MSAKISILVIAFFSISFGAAAQQKKHHQKARVAQGIKNGNITHAEAGKIRAERKEVREEIKDAKADGVITSAERTDIKQERKETNKAIRRAKHNNKTRN